MLWDVIKILWNAFENLAQAYLADVTRPGSFFLHAWSNQVYGRLASVLEVYHDLKVETAIVLLATAAARGRRARLAETARLTWSRADGTWQREEKLVERKG